VTSKLFPVTGKRLSLACRRG